ncbi:MAG TPA: RHS repeat domain-containing protein, partial [Thermoanaerobaculia bacterium]
ALRGLPVRLCTSQGKDSLGYGGGAMVGLSKREEIDENGTVKATWLYSGSAYFRHFVDANHDGFDDGDLNHNGVYDQGDVPICRTPVEFLATMLDPNGLLTVEYHNAAYGLGWYGAPFSPDPDRADTIQRHDGTQFTRFLSSETYAVDNSPTSPFVTNLGDAVRRMSRTYRDDNETAPAATRLRAKYAIYDESGYDCSGDGLPSDCREINLRETSEHTRYYDDPATITFGATMTNQVPFTESVFSDFDGLGHFRQTNTYGTLKAAAKLQRKASDFDVRAEYTFFNPAVTWQAGSNNPTGIPDRLTPWLIDLSSRNMIVENGRIGSTHTLFDSLRGYSKAVRKLKESTLNAGVALIPDANGQTAPLKDVDVGDGADDLLTVYTRTGQVSSDGPYEVTVREDSYGGDGGGLCASASGECAWSGGQLVAGSATADYSSETASRYGGVASTLYRGCGNAPYVHVSSAAIEHGAGLPTSVTDASGLTSNYTYDSLGRVTLVTPPGAATPQAYGYQSKTGTGGMNSLLITRSGGASSTYVYDYLGRLLTTTQDTPAGPATSSISY